MERGRWLFSGNVVTLAQHQRDTGLRAATSHNNPTAERPEHLPRVKEVERRDERSSEGEERSSENGGEEERPKERRDREGGGEESRGRKRRLGRAAIK
ncbi:hypothetical protein Sjap_019713 [Stephania japonica]|uniref:Uncharacterized protein n=1 Tax=Stephania japonica TaxID=461633 RepID=A0AAP0F878_9MAGN